ncbi:MAG: LysR family transcriptional regulator [Moraxellaceae bacterium]|nr:LysR family transcriptional regulator [Moraxellaceae bacterium]
MDRLQAMRLFVRICETGSFGRAADALGISRPAASITVQQLESELGTRLLSRSTRHVEVTPDGQAYRERCQRVLADIDEMDGLFHPAGSAPRGWLRVDVPSRIARRVLAPALPDWMANYPELLLELGSSDRAVDLLQEGVDCVIRVGALRDDRLVARPLGVFRQGSYASPAYLDQHGRPATPAELEGHLLVHYSSPPSAVWDRWEWVQDGETQSLALPARVAVNNAESYIACACAGLGLIQVPAYDVAELLASGELEEVLPDYRPAPMPVTLLYPRNRHLSRRIQAFAEWAESLFHDARMLAH